jgi:hypothetical protein
MLNRRPTVVHNGGTPSVTGLPDGAHTGLPDGAHTGLPDGAHALHLLTGEDAEEEADGYARDT